MISGKNISTLIAVATGLYAIIVCYFFNPFTLASQNNTPNLLIIGIGILSFTIALAILRVTLNRDKQTSALYFSVFVLSLVIPGLITWFFIDAQIEYFILYISAFFIASIPPTVLLLIWAVIPRFLNHGNTPIPEEKIEYFEIRNSKNRLVFRVNLDEIIQFEANDNYCVTHFLDDEENYKKSMDRISLKAVNDQISSKSESFFRVHKSHIINTKYLDKIGGKAQAHRLTLKYTESEVPVSRSFDINLLER